MNKKFAPKRQQKQKKQDRSSAPRAAAYPVSRRPSAGSIGIGTSSVVIRRRELVGTLSNGSSVGGFVIMGLSNVTPGYDVSITCGTLFPWGAQVGYAYEKYRFRKLHIELISGQPTTAGGRVYAAFDPDWSDDVPDSKTRIMGLVHSVDSSVWETVSLNVPAAAMNSGIDWRFCSPSSRAIDTEPRMAFAGFLCFGVDSPTANCVWDFWVDYEVELLMPTSENLGPVEAGSETLNVSGVEDVTGSFIYAPENWLMPAGPLEVVPPSVARVPDKILGVPVNYAVKLPSTGPQVGTLDFDFSFRDAITPPSTFIDASHAFGVDGALYNNMGVLLGYLSDLTGIPIATGATVRGEGDTLNAWCKSECALPIKKIKDAHPTASSIVPFLRSATNVALDFLRTYVTLTM